MLAAATVVQHRGKIIAALVVATAGALAFWLLAAGLLVGLLSQGPSDDSEDILCIPIGVPIAPGPPPTGPIADQQDSNAKAIAAVVDDLELGGYAKVVALTAAVGESDLINVDYGDSAGPDSRGLFQQRSTWGTEAQRMNPTYATRSFLLGPKHDGKDHGPGGTGLVAINGWRSLGISAAIHAVQINADPNHYTKFVSRAKQIAQRAGIDLSTADDPPAKDDPDDDYAGDCGSSDDNLGRIGDGPCPLDGKAPPGKQNPSTCNDALVFMKEQMDNGSTDWYRRCLALVMQAYGWAGGPATARDAAQIVIDAGMMSKDTKNIPRGAVMWWDGSEVGNAAGHVAIYDGKGHIYSNDVSGPGTVGRVPWEFVSDSWNQEFLGWSPAYFPTAV